MGRYLDRVDIESELGMVFDSRSSPSAAVAENIIEDIESEVSGLLSAIGVAVPVQKVASPHTFRIISTLILWAACARVQGIYSGNTLAPTAREEAYWLRYHSMWKKIKGLPNFLPDAVWNATDKGLGLSAILEGDADYHEVQFTLTGRH